MSSFGSPETGSVDLFRSVSEHLQSFVVADGLPARMQQWGSVQRDTFEFAGDNDWTLKRTILHIGGFVVRDRLYLENFANLEPGRITLWPPFRGQVTYAYRWDTANPHNLEERFAEVNLLIPKSRGLPGASDMCIKGYRRSWGTPVQRQINEIWDIASGFIQETSEHPHYGR